MNVDYVAERFVNFGASINLTPMSKFPPYSSQYRYPNARVTAATVAGHYFYATYYAGPNATQPGGMADFRSAFMCLNAFTSWLIYHLYFFISD